MSACSAYGCTSRPSKKIPGITFHSFPKDENRRKQWIIAVRRKDWLPSKCSTLCSNHFPEEMIDRTSLSSVRLRAHAVPQIFETIPSYLETKAINPGKGIDKSKVKSKQSKNSSKVTDKSKVKSKQSRNSSKVTVASTDDELLRQRQLDEQFDHVKPDMSSIAINNIVSLDSEKTVSNWTEETMLPISSEEMDSETDTDSDEENNSFTENTHGDSKEILKEKLEKMTARYKMSQTRLKHCRRQWKLCMNENTSLREVINSLSQIISVSDESCSEVKS